MTGPLSGVKVLEASQIVAGPVSGVSLSDFGADVVKLEPPGGEATRILGAFVPGESKAYHALNRGKRSLVIDLHQPEGQATVHRLIEGFDVFIVNSRPGVPQRLGIDYETLSSHRPDLIYMENTGYGSRGPSAARSGSDIIAQAYSGLMAGDGKVDQSGAPTLITSTAPADFTAGLAGAMGICAALYHRALTGEGQYLTTTLLGAALTLQNVFVSELPAVDAIIRDPMLERVNEVRQAGGSYQDILDARGDAFSIVGGAFRLYYGGYNVSDGAVIVGALTDANRAQVREVMGIENDPSEDPEFNALDPENQRAVEAVGEQIRAVMLTRTMDEWVAAFDAAGAPVSKVSLPEEMAQDPQVEEMGFLVDLEHDLTGPERMVGPILEMSGTPLVAERASPPLDAHTDEVLAEHGFTADEIAGLRSSKAIGGGAV